jgi:hypothetical protein
MAIGSTLVAEGGVAFAPAPTVVPFGARAHPAKRATVVVQLNPMSNSLNTNYPFVLQATVPEAYVNSVNTFTIR